MWKASIPSPRNDSIRRQVDRPNALQSRPRLSFHEEESPRSGENAFILSSRKFTRFRWATKSGARAASKSATGFLTSARSSTRWPSFARCGRPTTITAHCSFKFHTGRHAAAEGPLPHHRLPWVHYGLGSLERKHSRVRRAGQAGLQIAAAALGALATATSGPKHNGTELNADPANPLSFLRAGVRNLQAGTTSPVRTAAQVEQLLPRSNTPMTPALRARIKSYRELAFRMQSAIPEVIAIR